jgi:Flp pilus assembly protein TadD
MVLRSKEPSKDLARTAQYLNVRTLLILRAVERGESYHVHAEWIDPVLTAHLWGVQYVRKLDELYGLEDEISVNLAARIAPQLSSQQIAQIGKQYTTDGEAYQLYLKGRHLWNKRTADAITQGLRFYRKALDQDPGYALAFAGMAEGYLTLATFAFISPGDSLPRAKAAASRALELDPALGEARTALACIRAVYDWDWPAAERDFQLATSMAPMYSVAHQWYGACLCARGQFAEGRKALRTALALDPLSPMIGTQLGVGYYVEQQYKSAIRQFTSVLDLEPGFWAAYHFRGLCYHAEESRDDAIVNLRKAAELSGDTPFAIAALACVLARSGSAHQAEHLLSRLQATSATEYVPPYSLAIVYCGLDRREEALTHLEQSAEERSPSIALWLQREPLLHPLRREPRFQRLLQTAGLL